MRNLVRDWATAIVGYLSVDGLVFRVRRVRTAELARTGLAHLEGTEAYREIRAEAAADRERQLLALNRTPAELAEAQGEADEARLVRTLRNLARLEETPQGREALLARSDAYVCAALDGAAQLVTPVDRPTIDVSPPPIVTVDPETGAPYPDGGWAPWRWSTSEEDHDRGIASLQRRTEADRHLWAQLIQILLHRETRQAVEPFRPGPGGAATTARPGEGLPHGPVVGGGVEPGADSGGGGGARGGDPA